MDSGQQRSRQPEAGLRTTSGGWKAAVGSSAKCARQGGKAHITEKFGEASSSVIPEVVNMLRERLSVVVGAEGASPSTTSQIENKGGFGTVRERKKIRFVPYQPEEERYYYHFFSINFEGDEKRKINRLL